MSKKKKKKRRGSFEEPVTYVAYGLNRMGEEIRVAYDEEYDTAYLLDKDGHRSQFIVTKFKFLRWAEK